MVERVESLERKVEAQREENAMLTTRIEDLVHELEAAKQTIDRQGGELEAAKEEIAVKVAQVKQYQKQVEAYKQQVLYMIIYMYTYVHACLHIKYQFRVQYVPLFNISKALNA